MTKPLRDQAAREQITGALDANLGVEAGAGTGKTTVLVERVTNVLATGKATVDQLAVITFTEKAAAELSTRVRDALEARARPVKGAERVRVLTAARDLYRCHIETIHSFATSLLRERPVEAGIDPLFEVVDGLAGSLSFDAAYEAFQDQLLATRSPALDRALRRGLGLTELREACELLNQYRYLRPLWIPTDAAGELAGHLAELVSIAGELRALLVACDPGDDAAVGIVETIIEWTDGLAALETEAEQEFQLLFRGAAYTHESRGSQANWGVEGKAQLKGLQKAYKAAVAVAREGLRTDALLSLLPEIERFVDTYEAQRLKAGEPDFDDLLFWARDLLRNSTPARDYFRRRYKVVLIDEFQDTDPVQAELALLLTSDQQPDGDWRSLRPGPGRLTVVGDPKQSIYRFRRADIAVYDQVRTHALAGGHEQIATNFRSNPQLLAALNHAFDTILHQQPGVQPANVRLDAPPGAHAARRPPVSLVLGEVDGKAGERREQEAWAIAAMLHTAHSDEWEIRDRRDRDRWRPCRWGDMAILMPARTGIELYEHALADAGIPYRHEGSRDFYQRHEVRDLIWVLAAVDDPTDRLALLGALRSSAFAINDEDLVRHRAATGTLSYRSKTEGPIAAVNDALSELADLHRMRTRFSLAETVRRVVERTRLVEFALTRPDGDQGAVNLLAIVDQARLFTAAGGGGLRPFVRHLHNSVEQDQIEIEATVAEQTDDVVRIMTIHGAKGLEYPIVALANLAAENRNHAQPVPREDENFLHFRVGAGSIGRTGHFNTPGYDNAWEQEKHHVDAERQRLLYVAATRARDHLIVPCVAGIPNAKGLLGQLIHALPVDNHELVARIELDDLELPDADQTPPAPVTDADIQTGVTEREQWLTDLQRLKRNASTPRKIEIASSRERPRGPLAAEVATFDAAMLIGDGPPIPIGDAVHMVMERVTLPDAHDLEQIADDVCKEGAITSDTDDVISMCRACLDSPSVKRALELGSWWREVPFVINHADDEVAAERAPLTNGRVDLVFRDGDKLVVIDYKTDKDVTEQTAEQYALKHHGRQGEVYAQGLATATGLKVREVAFVYCKAGAEVRLREGAVVH
ncbi:MAG: UvrD-helicase domain-containing protein [Solirubrobacteraceae bacterium]